jgi:Flp pilus assembly protein TadD
MPFARNPIIRFAAALAVMICLISGCNAPLQNSQPGIEAAFPGDAKRQAIHLDEKQKIEIQMGFARTLEVQGHLDRAETFYREILATQPKHVSAMHRLAIVCDSQRRFDESKPLFLKAIDLAPQDVSLWGDYGYSLYRQQKWDEAESKCRRAPELNPRDKRIHNHLGLVLAQKGQADAAVAEFLLAGCSESEAQSNLQTIQKLNGGTTFDEKPSELALHASHRPLPETEVPAAPFSPQVPGSAKVHINSH